ncbi:MAG TPA: mannose-1-phosphate guanylyltransferase [Acidisarcina sp.]
MVDSVSGVEFCPVILAGGSGTRFWPRSRKARAKQVLALDGDRTMIQQTVARLAPLATAKDVWVITNGILAETIGAQLEGVPARQIVQEPAARNTAPAAGLAAFLVEKSNPDAVLGVFPADHVIADELNFRAVLQKAIALASDGENMVVLGVAPTRAETGYGYIETGGSLDSDSPDGPGSTYGMGYGAVQVRRFTEKPDAARAEQFRAAGNFYWNSGIFIWSARTLANAIREHLPQTAPLLKQIADAWGTPQFDSVFAELYPKCENISVDYAVLEPRSQKGEGKSHLYCLPANFGWNDLGSWAALYEHQLAKAAASDPDENVFEVADSIAIDARRNYAYSPGKFVALVGVDDIVVVETEDAILVTTRHRSQDVGRIVKTLAAARRDELI